MENRINGTYQEFNQISHTVDLTGLCGEAFDEYSLFMVYFHAIPNIVKEEMIDCKKANKWFTDTFRTEIKNYHYIKRYAGRKKSAVLNDMYYTLYDDLLVYFDTDNSDVTFLFRMTDEGKVEKLISEIKKFSKRRTRTKPQIELLVRSGSGLGTRSFNLTKPKLSIADNYNEDLTPVHRTILKRLSQKNDKGLVLLHGKPGTGKTSYIRYLVWSVRNKNVIFLPPDLAASITDPDLMKVLIGNPNSIFIIEDAENIIIDRERRGASPVSALLNISDGLLSDCLNIQIICSFNTDLSKVDSALMRKGRLIAQYEFKELCAGKAQALSDKLGFSSKIDSPMLLTAIYNQHENDFPSIKKRASIGFGTNFPEKQVV
jgi:hypothetical protein